MSNFDLGRIAVATVRRAKVECYNSSRVLYIMLN
jgi:hypothetical protein